MRCDRRDADPGRRQLAVELAGGGQRQIDPSDRRELLRDRDAVVASGSGIISAAVLLWRFNDPNWTDLGASGGGGGSDLRLVLRAAPGGETCRINAVELSSGTSVSGGASVGVRERNMSVAFTSVAIYRSP